MHASAIWTEHKNREATGVTVGSMLVGKTQCEKNIAMSRVLVVLYISLCKGVGASRDS